MDKDKKHEMKTAVTPSPMQSTYMIVTLVALLVAGSFMLGSLWTKVQFMEKYGTSGQKVAGADAGPQALGAQAPQAPPARPAAGEVPKVTKDDWVFGNRNAEIALVEYSDLECPFCKRFHPTAQQAIDTYKGRVMWVYRHYPLSFHANAQKEAEASECAAELGGNDIFWKFINTITERTTSNGTGFALDNLVPLAKELGINDAKFKECLDSGRMAAKIKSQQDGGTKAGVNGTPGNIILSMKTGETRVLAGAVPFEDVKAAIDSLLK
ncbi:thioredoxin domain-containing protein [Candidatus Gottesmanbacteria bacterium]|nr:thioredoxin domain-containing protein [Candidatus Gottesmanbacteria bacterium]